MKCEYCGNLHNNKKYCGQECYKNHKKHLLQFNKTFKICGVCGNEFEVHGSESPKYCSYKCSGAAKRINSREIRVCIICGNEFSEYKKHKKTTCSKKCLSVLNSSDEVNVKRMESLRNTNIKKYGVESFLSTDEFKKLSKSTKLKKYGDENYVNSEKAIQTKKIRYGIDDFNNINKNKQTKLDRYGDCNYNNREKFKETMLTKFGGIGLQRKEVLRSANEAFFQKYGVTNSFNSDEIKEKIVNSFIKKYGKSTYAGSDSQKKLLTERMLKKLESNLSAIGYKLISTYSTKRSKTSDNKLTYNKYQFECMKCGNIFIDNLCNNNLPSCNVCNPVTKSRGETDLYNYIISLIPQDLVYRNYRHILNNGHELDIYIPSKKIAIEYNGLYWHSDRMGKKDKNYHLSKTVDCESKGIHLIHIYEDDWLYKNDIVKNKLKNLLIAPDEKIYARKCKIIEISSSEKNEFLNLYHIQGEDKSSIKLGAYYENELVAVMTFGNPRVSLGISNNNNNFFELIRFATSKKVIGIASKLLKYFIRMYSPIKIISYADRSWSSELKDTVYAKMNFIKSYDTSPNYWYIINGVRVHRFNYRKDILKKKLNIYDDNLTEWQNMQLNGYDRIWDCGNIKYELKF